ADDELPDGAAAGDPCYEHAHERRPAYPPRPVEDGPARNEGRVAVGGGPEAHGDDVGQVAADRLGEGVEDEHRRSHHEQEEQQEHGQNHVGVGDPLYAAVYPTDRRQDERQGQDDDHHYGQPDGLTSSDPEHRVEALVDLQGAQPQRGGRAEQGGEYRQDVDGLAYGPVDPVAQQRVERRADQVRHPPAESEVGEGQSHDRVDRPRVESPVEVGVLHRDLGGPLRVGLSQPKRGG